MLAEGGALMSVFAQGEADQKATGETLSAWHSLLESQLVISKAATEFQDNILLLDQHNGKDYSALCSKEMGLRKLDPNGLIVGTWTSLEELKKSLSESMSVAANAWLEKAVKSLEKTTLVNSKWGDGVTLTSTWTDIQQASKPLFEVSYASAIKADFHGAVKARL